MLSCGEKFLKYLMFIFNLLFVIIGLGLMIAGGIAQAHYDKWYNFISNGTITGPALVIVVGVFLFLVSFFGCCGAIRESYGMLMTYTVVVAFLFILQMAGGIAALVQKNEIESYIRPDLAVFIQNYSNETKPVQELIDALQIEGKCCGASNFTDYPMAKDNTIPVPSSCCKTGGCNVVIPKDACAVDSEKPDCPINTRGCQQHLTDLMMFAINAAGGAAIGLAFIELIGVWFAFTLARGVRDGFTYG